MKAREIVSIIYQYNSDWSREILLANVNYIHEIMMGHRNLYTLYTDPTTGGDPEITPTTVEYEITDGMDIQAVYTDSDCIGPGWRGWLGTKYGEVNPYCTNGVKHIYDNVIIFDENALNKTYKVRYYKKPTQVLSENTVLDIPDRYKRHLIKGVNAYMEYQTNGSDNAMDKWERKELRQFWGLMNKQFVFKGNTDEQRAFRTSY